MPRTVSLNADDLIRLLHSSACDTRPATARPFIEDSETDQVVICGVFNMDRAAHLFTIHVNNLLDLEAADRQD